MGQNGDLVALPGAHTKWAMVKNGAIERFATYMTGEIGARSNRTLWSARLIPAQSADNPDAFLRGVRLAWDRGIGGNILRRFFGAQHGPLRRPRSLPISADYLSGLLIGAEIDEVFQEYGPPGQARHPDRPTRSLPALHLALREAGMTSAIVENAGTFSASDPRLRTNGGSKPCLPTA